MDKEQRKVWIGVGIAVLVAGLLVGFYFIFRKEEEEVSKPQAKVWNRARATQTMHQLCLFADSLGIDTTRYSLASATTQKESDTKFAQ